MYEYTTPIKALKIERQKWHQGMVLARKGKYALNEKELKLYVDEYNTCDDAIKTLQGEVIAEGRVKFDDDFRQTIGDTYMSISLRGVLKEHLGKKGKLRLQIDK